MYHLKFEIRNDLEINNFKFTHVIKCLAISQVYTSNFPTSWTVRGSNPSVGEIFRPSRPVLGTTQPPVKWVPGLSRG
jgi:hypothetical protein